MEVICLGFLLGIVFSLITLGAGVLYYDRIDKRKHRDDPDPVVHVLCRDRSGRSNIRSINEMESEALADTIDAMAFTGISPTEYEKAYLHEAAERLRKEQK